MGYIWDYIGKGAYNNRVGRYKFKRQHEFIIKNGEKYLAYAFENGKKMEDMKKRSVFYYNIRTDKGEF